LKHTLVLVRHGQSTWNLENKFTGWYDVELSETGHEGAKEAGKLLAESGFKFDKAYTSVLKRAIRTLWHSLEQTDQMWIPVQNEWRLNERHYGVLTGLDKQETVDKHGKEQVLIWRRSFDIPPPPLEESSEHFPGNDVRYSMLPKDILPKGESLKTTAERVMPLWADSIVPDIKSGKKLIIAAHGNSLRALVKHLDNISDDENEIDTIIMSDNKAKKKGGPDKDDDGDDDDEEEKKKDDNESSEDEEEKKRKIIEANAKARQEREANLTDEWREKREANRKRMEEVKKKREMDAKRKAEEAKKAEEKKLE